MHIVLTENCTADGVIDLAAGWFNPADQTDDQLLTATRAHMAEQDALLLGRGTFEAFRSYWPNQTDDTTGITDHLNRVQKYVLSTTLHEPDGSRPQSCETSTRCARCGIGREIWE